jgi:DNA repair exonuclease SbcCD ATPase subunit
METAHATWRPLGELIVERGLITQEQLEDALLEQRITHKRLGTILVDKGIVSAQELTDSLVDQIGVEDLLDEFDRTETEAGEHRSARRFGAPLRRVRERLHGVELPSPARLATPFVRLGARTAELGRRGRNGGSQPDTPITSTPPFETEEYLSETTVVEIVELETVELGTVDLVATQIEAPEAAEPHAWLAVARGALEEAEADLSRLDDAVFAQSHELADVRKELASRESELAQESSAHRRAEEEVGRLHALIDERDTGLTAMEATVEELREQRTAVQSELADLRLDFEGSSRALERTQQELSERTARIAQLEAAMKDHEQRGHRITELEAQAADLAETFPRPTRRSGSRCTPASRPSARPSGYRTSSTTATHASPSWHVRSRRSRPSCR